MKTLTVTIDATLLKIDTVIVQPYNESLSNFQILANASLFCVESKRLSPMTQRFNLHARARPRLCS
eukprot:m.68066 g.68066  ORF g.68066 m.68066 type:complete len:66 (-) comp23906_c0_seq5:269-466(-)